MKKTILVLNLLAVSGLMSGCFTTKSISDIATTCGYATVSWFGVQFKKFYGCTPKAYREKLR